MKTLKIPLTLELEVRGDVMATNQEGAKRRSLIRRQLARILEHSTAAEAIAEGLDGATDPGGVLAVTLRLSKTHEF